MRKLHLLIIIGVVAAVPSWGMDGAATGPAGLIEGPTSPPAAPASPGSSAPAPAVVIADGASSSDAGAVNLLSAGDGGCTFEIKIPQLGVKTVEAGGRQFERYTLPGYGREGTAGNPELLMKTVNVAVPPGAEVAVRVDRVSYDVRAGKLPYPSPQIDVERRRDEVTLRETFTFNEEAYRSGVYPAKWAEVVDQGILRGYRVIAVGVYPYVYDAEKGALRVASDIVVSVSFSGGVTRPNATYMERPREEGVFSRLVPGLVLNWEAASRWPFAEILPQTDAGIWPTSFMDKPALKIILDEMALYRLNYNELKAKGFPVDTLRPANLRLYAASGREISRDINVVPEGLTEVPCYVAGQEDGIFGPGDYVEFYGRGCDYFDPIEPDENKATQAYIKNRFAKYNVYWLVADNTVGKRAVAARRPAAGGIRPGYFWDRIHMEIDSVDIVESSQGIDIDEDYFLWMQFIGMKNAPNALLVGTFNIWDPVTNGDDALFKIQVRPAAVYQNGPCHSKAFVNAHDPANLIFDGVSEYQEPTDFYRNDVPMALLRNGRNTFWFEETGDQIGPSNTVDSLFLNYYEFEYPRQYRAHQGYLRFANPVNVTGDVLFEIKGFDDDDIVVYDVTRGRRLTDFEVKAQDGTYTVRFTDNIPSGQCWYVAATAAAADKDPVDTFPDVGSRLREDDEDRDLIVVTYDDYVDNIQPLVNWRRAQGLGVAVARVSDIYDEYNGGVFDPGAIRLYVRDLYIKGLHREGGRLPDHLMLVGDAWRDWRDAEGKYPDHKLYRDFGMNQCPTYYIRTEYASRTASDNYFVAFDVSGWPDMTVGRLSCPFDENVDAIVDKILSYEREPVNGPWTARCLLVADNEDVNTEGGSGGSGDFTEATEDLADFFFPYGFEARKEYVTWLNRHFDGTAGFDGLNREDRKRYCREIMKPDFRKRWDALIVGYSGHGGPQAWSHETLLAHHKDVPIVDDMYELHNGPRYPIVFQCSCSTCYFDDERQTNPNDPPDYGQSISEYGIHQPHDGAVAMMGSSRVGYEQPQNLFMQAFYDYVFPDRRPRTAAITVGEAHFGGKVGSGQGSIREEFTLLGDPAMPVALPKPGITLIPAKTSLRLGETLAITGTVPDNLNGKATVSLFDQVYYCTDRKTAENIFRDRLVATAEVEVRNGRFDVTFTVPITPESPLPPLPSDSDGETVTAASVAGTAAPAGVTDGAATASAPAAGGIYHPIADNGRLFVRAVAYGTGFRQSYFCAEEVGVNVAGSITSNDHTGPEVDIYLGDRTFRDGDPVGSNPELLVDLSDPSGVLIARNTETIGAGEQIFLPLTAKVDAGAALDLTHYYTPTYNDTRGGSAETRLALGGGTHRIAITAYDSFGNKTTKSVQCYVSGALSIVNVMNCPNPFDDETYFTFRATTDVDSLSIKVYTATGRLVQRIDAGSLGAGYHQIRWEGHDRAGDPIANGVYFYTITARAGDQKIVVREKLVKLK